MKRIYDLIVLSMFLCPCFLTAQNDSLPPPSMKSDKLITLDDYNPDAVYGSSYVDMMNNIKKKDNRNKTIFNRQGSKFIIPTLFIAYGTAARFNQLPIRQFDYDIDHEIRKRCTHQYSIDNYFEYATPILAYGLGFIPGIKSEHNFRDRTLIMATSYLVMEGMVQGLKRTVPVMRPRGWGDESFPSGHMSVTMTGAHIMYKEYKNVSPGIGLAGYLMATTVGAYRMFNYAHWFSDVIMGAGIGLLSAEIGYMMLPVWHKLFGINDGGSSFVAMPTVGTNSLGVGLAFQF